MGQFASQIIEFVNSTRPLIIALVAVAFVINGALFIYPNERGKEKAKEAIPFVILGSAVALGAVALANSLTSGF